MEVFSTHGVAATHKAAQWNAMLRGLTDTIEVWPSNPLRFDGTLTRQRIGRLTLFEIRCSSVRLQHTRNQGVHTRDASYQVLMPVQGQFSLTHRLQSGTIVPAGSFCLIDRAEPYELMHGDGLRAIGVELPHSLLESCLPQARHHAGTILRPNSGPSRVLAGLLRTLGAELSLEARESFPAGMARSIAGFVAAAYAGPEMNLRCKGIKAKLHAYRDYAESRLRDADFRPTEVAREFAVSARYVREVFQSAGEPLSEFLLRRRLECAAQLLRSADYADQTVTQVALECGFNGVSQFGHRFRQRYGVTPRIYRQGET